MIKQPSHLSIELTTKLLGKLTRYQGFLDEKFKDKIFFHQGCDGLLFSGLMSVGISNVDMLSARNICGQWYRKPIAYGFCYPNDSWSEISRDMILGLLYWIWFHKKAEVLDDLIRYAKEHWWVMGKGKWDISILTPSMYGTMKMMQAKFKGNDTAWSRTPLIPIPLKDFRAHLLGLHMLLRAEITGDMPECHYQWFYKQWTRQPQNLFYGYVCRAYHQAFPDFTDIAFGLLNLSLFPENRLPSALDRRESYLWQRDLNGFDWSSDPQGKDKEHCGADFAFVAGLILKDVINGSISYS